MGAGADWVRRQDGKVERSQRRAAVAGWRSGVCS